MLSWSDQTPPTDRTFADVADEYARWAKSTLDAAELIDELTDGSRYLTEQLDEMHAIRDAQEAYIHQQDEERARLEAQVTAGRTIIHRQSRETVRLHAENAALRQAQRRIPRYEVAICALMAGWERLWWALTGPRRHEVMGGFVLWVALVSVCLGIYLRFGV